MVQVLMVVLGIILTSALTLTAVSYFGDIAGKSSSDAQTAALLNEAVQVTGAYDMYSLHKAEVPTAMTDLIGAEDYLRSDLTGSWVIANGAASLTSVHGDTINDNTCEEVNMKLGLGASIPLCSDPVPTGATSYCCSDL